MGKINCVRGSVLTILYLLGLSLLVNASVESREMNTNEGYGKASSYLQTHAVRMLQYDCRDMVYVVHTEGQYY